MKNSGQMVNIPRSKIDSGYRYRMPLLNTKIIGKGINVRTELTNLKEVSKALFIDQEYILKFMGYDFGTQTNLIRDKKTKEVIVTSLNGTLSHEDVLKSLDKFIEKFILCQQDKIPEMVIHVESGEVIGKCKACGHISQIDISHKLTSFMKNKPPKNLHETLKAKEDFEKDDKETEINVNKIKYQIRRLLKENDLNPFKEENKEVIDLIHNYLSMVLPLDNDYLFDDSHSEIIYKAIKHLKMPNEMFDKVGYILFSYIFNENILSQIPTRAILFEQVMLRHRFKGYLSYEIILNLGFFCFELYKEQDWSKKIPSIIMLFLDNEEKLDLDLLTEKKVLKWGKSDEKVKDFFARHCLYKEEIDNKLKEVCTPVFGYLDDGEEDDESEEEDEQDEDNEQDEDESEGESEDGSEDGSEDN